MLRLEKNIMPKSLKEYLGLPTVSIGGLDSYHPIASLGDTPPKGKGSRDSRVTGLQANYDTQAPGTMRPFLTAAKKVQAKNKKEKIKEDLYSDDNPKDTVKGTGYGDAATARKTLSIIKSVDKTRQFQIVNTLYNRAKHHANQTSDMRSAMSIFKTWLDNNKKKESVLYKHLLDKKIIKE